MVKQHLRRALRTVAACLLSAGLALGSQSIAMAATEEDPSPTTTMVGTSHNSAAISNTILDGATVRIRPHGYTSALAINNDGNAAGRPAVHLWEIGNSARLYLQKAKDDNTSYQITFFPEFYSTSHVNDVFEPDVDVKIFGSDNWSVEEATIHVVDVTSSNHSYFEFIPAGNGLYKIMCVISGKYWSIKDENKNGVWDNGDHLCQVSSDKATTFEMEIVNPGSKDLASIKNQSSYTFNYNGKTVSAANWMSALPDDTPITDLNIPGTHDTGTCNVQAIDGGALAPGGKLILKVIDDTEFAIAQCQQLYYDDQLRSGVRSFDLRCNIMINDGAGLFHTDEWSPAINHTLYCVDRDGTPLSMNDIWEHTNEFWSTSAGSQETIIWSVSEQELLGAVDTQKIYDYFKGLVEAHPERFYIGDHVPTLSEVRGKIIILSKLNPSSLDSSSNYIYKGTKSDKWAFDITTTEQNVDFTTANDTELVRQDTNYEVWIEDDYKTNAETKWNRSTTPALNKAYTHRDNAIANKKYAWMIIYTSASAPDNDNTTPINAAKYTNKRVKSYFDSSLNNTINTSTKNGKYAGIVFMDFLDEQQCQFVYRQNFIMDMPKVANSSSDTSTVNTPRYNERQPSYYSSWDFTTTESTTASTSSASSTSGTWKRCGGSDRYETMSSIVSAGFTESDYAVLATGTSFPDALTASSIAGAHDCPVLLTDGQTLSSQARHQLERLGVRDVCIVGGEASVSASVEAELAAMGITVHRMAGADRVATSVAAFRETRATDASSNTVVIATGDGFADALSIGSWCYATRTPIVLVRNGVLSEEAVSAIKADGGISRVVIVGGTAVVSDNVMAQLGEGFEYVRLAGADRYETSAAIASWAAANGLSNTKVCVATGSTFPDALAGAALAGKKRAIVLLDNGAGSAKRWLADKAGTLTDAFVLGGEAAISADVMAALQQ